MVIADLERAVRVARAHDGLSVVEVMIDPAEYRAGVTLTAMIWRSID